MSSSAFLVALATMSALAAGECLGSLYPPWARRPEKILGCDGAASAMCWGCRARGGAALEWAAAAAFGTGRRRQEMRAVGDLGEAATAAGDACGGGGGGFGESTTAADARGGIWGRRGGGIFWLSPSQLTPGEFAKTPAVRFLSLAGGPKCSYHRQRRLIRRG